jgi:hypothetical protein
MFQGPTCRVCPQQQPSGLLAEKAMRARASPAMPALATSTRCVRKEMHQGLVFEAAAGARPNLQQAVSQTVRLDGLSHLNRHRLECRCVLLQVDEAAGDALGELVLAARHVVSCEVQRPIRRRSGSAGICSAQVSYLGVVRSKCTTAIALPTFFGVVDSRPPDSRDRRLGLRRPAIWCCFRFAAGRRPRHPAAPPPTAPPPRVGSRPHAVKHAG